MNNIIKLIINDLDNIKISDDIKNQLDKIEIIENDRNMIKTNAYSLLSKSLNSIININYRDLLLSLKDIDSRINIIKQIVKWSQHLWKESITQTKLDKMILSYSIIDYLYLPEDLLNWDIQEQEISEKFERMLSTLLIKIDIPKNANYFDKSSFTNYQNGNENEDFKKIFYFINAFEKGNQFEKFDRFIYILVKIAYRINLSTLISLLGKSEPVVATFILKSLDIENIITILSSLYNESSLFPLLKGFIQAIHHYDELILQNDDIIESISLDKLVMILKKICQKQKYENPIINLMNLGNIKYSKTFHSVCGVFIAEVTENLSFYLEGLDFSLEDKQYGEKFYYFLEKYCNNVNKLNDIATQISNKYYSFLKEKGNVLPVNRYTSFLNFIFKSINNSIKIKEDYAKLLNNKLKELNDVRYSWNINNLKYHYIIIFYHIIYNIFFSIDFSNNKELINDILLFIKDERNIPIFDDISSDLLLNCLLNPNKIHKIELKLENEIGKIISIGKVKK